jgi:hypothetical protein
MQNKEDLESRLGLERNPHASHFYLGLHLTIIRVSQNGDGPVDSLRRAGSGPGCRSVSCQTSRSWAGHDDQSRV